MVATKEFNWKTDNPFWVNREEQLAPDVWLFICKRPDGFDWPAHRDDLIGWAHVYVFDNPINSRDRKTLDHFTLNEVDPLMLSCLEYEMRKKYAHSADTTNSP